MELPVSMRLVSSVSRGWGEGAQTGRLQGGQIQTSLSKKTEGEGAGGNEGLFINKGKGDLSMKIGRTETGGNRGIKEIEEQEVKERR